MAVNAVINEDITITETEFDVVMIQETQGGPSSSDAFFKAVELSLIRKINLVRSYEHITFSRHGNTF